MKTKFIIRSLLAVACSYVSNVVASTITLAPGTNPEPIGRSGAGQSYTLDPSLSDWLLGSGNKKLGGSMTYTTTAAAVTNTDFPNFTYSNGTSPTSATDENSYYRLTSSSPLNIFIPLPQGSGQLSLWLGNQLNNNLNSFTADFPDTPGTDFSTFFGGAFASPTSEQWHLNYDSSVAQTMTVTITTGNNNGNAGFLAVAVSQVPEPSTFLFGLIGLAGVLFRRPRNARNA